MFWKKEAAANEAVKKTIRDLSTPHHKGSISTRRAISMVPEAPNKGEEIAHTASVRFHHLLVSLEGNQRTGCLKIISPRKKSRSAILIYRGRVVGCVYGRKDLSFQVLNKDAHRQALTDLASPGNVLNAYQLTDELVLAAASLFHGHILDVDQRQPTVDRLVNAVGRLNEARVPGCVVVATAQDEMVCMVYCEGGRVVGVYAAHTGWVQPTLDSAVRCLPADVAIKVMASFLSASDVQKANTMGFSLTGLGDGTAKAVYVPHVQAIDAFAGLGQTYSNTYTRLRSTKDGQPKAKHQPLPREVFAIAP